MTRTLVSWVRIGLAVSLGSAVITLNGCASTGPIAVQGEQPLQGLNALLNTPGTVNIFIAHGMRGEKDNNQANVQMALKTRLHLTPDKPWVQGQPTADVEIPLLNGPNTWPAKLHLDGPPFYHDQADWAENGMGLSLFTYHAPSGQKVVFYVFNYWRPLARMKCMELVSPDSRLVGPSDVGKFCQGLGINATIAAQSESNSPVIGNKFLKTEIMTFGFGDATLVVSPFRQVLRDAVREAFTLEMRAVVGEAADGKAPQTLMDDRAPADISNRFAEIVRGDRSKHPADGTPKFAVITESLGGYVLLDALIHEQAVGAPRAGSVPDAASQVICQTSQFHMLANQIDLLRLSETSTDDPPPPPVTCASQRAGRPPMQLVAYHDPNDQLTFYVTHMDTVKKMLGSDVVNVVAPFTDIWAPFLLADPLKAHVGQETDRRIQDIVAGGWPNRR